MYRKSAVGKKQQFEFSGGRPMEDRHRTLLIPSWSRGTDQAAPTVPLHLCTALPTPSFSCCPLQTPLLISPANFPVLSLLCKFLMQKQELLSSSCSPHPKAPLPRDLGKAKPMWGRELQHKRALGAS